MDQLGTKKRRAEQRVVPESIGSTIYGHPYLGWASTFRQKSGDRHQPTSQQSSHRNHGHNNDRHGSDRRGGGDNHRSSNNNYSGNNNMLNFKSIQSSSTPKHDPNITKSGDRHQPTTQQSSHRSHGNNNDHHGSDRRGGGDNHRSSRVPVIGVTREIGVSSLTDLSILVPSSPGVPLRATPTQSALRVDADTQESVIELLTDKKSGASGRVFAIIEDHATKTSGMDWLTEHHATIDCHSYRVIFGDIHAPEFIYHGSLPGKSMHIISALQARTLLSHDCEGFLATIHDTTSDVPSIHDQSIVSEFPDVFPDELPGIPSVRKVEFSIELIPGAEPISKAPYRMALIELKEI
nr:putative reverse transcriptase domain, aspartic peptidase domain protein [Tanacetum cinerariifolium]